MTDKKFYITIEVTAQVSGDMAKDTPENRKIYSNNLYKFANSTKRELNYDFYIHGEKVLCIMDEKGRDIL